MKENRDKYIEMIIREKQTVNNRRYESFKQRLSMAIAILTLIVTIILFVLKDYFYNIYFLFNHIKNEPLISISILLIILLFILLILYNLFRAIRLLFNALKPAVLQHIDYESLDKILSGNLEKGKKILFRDLKNSNDENEKQLNKKYTDINHIFVFLLKALCFIIILILIIFILTTIKDLVVTPNATLLPEELSSSVSDTPSQHSATIQSHQHQDEH